MSNPAEWPTFPQLIGTVLPPGAFAHGDSLAKELAFSKPAPETAAASSAYAAAPSSAARHGDVFEKSLALERTACPSVTTIAPGGGGGGK